MKRKKRERGNKGKEALASCTTWLWGYTDIAHTARTTTLHTNGNAQRGREPTEDAISLLTSSVARRLHGIRGDDTGKAGEPATVVRGLCLFEPRCLSRERARFPPLPALAHSASAPQFGFDQGSLSASLILQYNATTLTWSPSLRRPHHWAIL